MLSPERQSAQMSKITNDGLTRCGRMLYSWLYPYGNSGRQRVNLDELWYRSSQWSLVSEHLIYAML